MQQTTVLSVGGSIISPDGVDVEFLKRFVTAIEEYLQSHPHQRFILVSGGGAPARTYQQAYKQIDPQPDSELLDWIGIAATRLNGMLLRSLFARYCSTDLVTDPSAEFTFEGRVLVAAGWKPGFSSDADAVYLAIRFGSETVINLSNIAKVYTADPKLDPLARPLDAISWQEFRKMVGDQWIPGKNLPFDPIASKEAQQANLKVICADGRNIANLMAILNNKEFEGTLIS
ncbi:MAG: UMP kinase [Sphaerochaetaceae bacterium]